MKLDLEKIKSLHDKAYTHNQVTRERAADDLVFYWVTHWDDTALDEVQLAYRGEFDVLRKAGRSILADLSSNPVQVDFEPRDDNKEDISEVLDGMYRNDCRNNTSIEAFSNADQECVVCGFGAWELYTEYQTNRAGDKTQVIRRRPIYEANNTVFFDPNAKLLDKSDASYCSILFSYSRDGYLDLVEELTGERRDDIKPSNFASPVQLSFPWISSEAGEVYVSQFYHRKKISKKIFTLVNMMGQEVTVDEKELKETEDDLMESGFEIAEERKIDAYEVTRYICSGEEILDKTVIAGQYIPVIPEYGEHAFVGGAEHYEGVTRLAKDPQRLRDFMMCYIADIASRSPRDKPIFHPAQIKGFEDMYSVSGADNNYPYLLANSHDADGNPLPIGPVGTLTAPQIPQAVASLIQLTRESISDVADAGMPQDIADVDISGKAVLALQAKVDKQSLIYQTNRKHAKRRDGEVYASIAAVVNDVPREVKMVLPDGQTKTDRLMETVVDSETGEIVTRNDLRNVEFDVYSKISADWSSQKEQTLDRLSNMVQGIPPGDPMRNILMLKILGMMDGVDFDEIRDYAKQQLMILGIRKPETDEEMQFMQQSQEQGQKPDPNMVLAMAEQMKAEADMLREKREVISMEMEFKDKETQRQIQMFDAETKRFNSDIDAQKAGATIDKDQADAMSKKIDNQQKMVQMNDPKNMTTDELMLELMQAYAQ